MDIVITYVNGLDPFWQKEYAEFTNKPIINKRYRDWGTLKYLLRGIETKMPFIDNVFLVVSSESQVPKWADRNHLHIVLHKDIIPEKFLPTFNSTTIELFLHNISGLDEEFIYFNDDIFPVMDCRKTDFFRDGRIVMGFSHHLFALNMYKRQCRNSDHIARKILGMPASPTFLRQQHTCTPMLKSECAKVYSSGQGYIENRISAIRTDKNVNQYIFADYLFFKHLVVKERHSKKHISVAASSAEKIGEFLLHPDKKLVCINDVDIKEEKYNKMKSAIISSFENLFPDKSRFEK